MADEEKKPAGPVTRHQQLQQQREAAQETARKELKRQRKVINQLADTEEGVQFLNWLYDITNMRQPTYIQSVILGNVGVDPYLAGYAEGRRSLGSLIELSLTPENRIKLMKPLEVEND